MYSKVIKTYKGKGDLAGGVALGQELTHVLDRDNGSRLDDCWRDGGLVIGGGLAILGDLGINGGLAILGLLSVLGLLGVSGCLSILRLFAILRLLAILRFLGLLSVLGLLLAILRFLLTLPLLTFNLLSILTTMFFLIFICKLICRLSIILVMFLILMVMTMLLPLLPALNTLLPLFVRNINSLVSILLISIHNRQNPLSLRPILDNPLAQHRGLLLLVCNLLDCRLDLLLVLLLLLLMILLELMVMTVGTELPEFGLKGGNVVNVVGGHGAFGDLLLRFAARSLMMVMVLFGMRLVHLLVDVLVEVVVTMGVELPELGLKGAVAGRGLYILDILLCLGYIEK